MVTDDREILPPQRNHFEPVDRAAARAETQEQIVWKLVWLRRVVYFATVIVSLHLLL